LVRTTYAFGAPEVSRIDPGRLLSVAPTGEQRARGDALATGGPPGDDVIAGAQRGDAGAFEALYDAYVARVLGYVRGLGVEEPEDTVSEVFVSVVRSLPTFVGDEADFRRWLFTIAHRRAVDSHRRRTRRREQPTDPLLLPDVATAGDATDAVNAQLSSTAASEALAQLTPDQREVILLRVVADLSVADAAAVLGKQPGAVKTLQRRALASLRRLMILTAVS
jgi:RNA polymerase sigma factor (sigma-70 family)